MERRKLGRQGLEVSAIGLGCMGMTWAYGKPDQAEVIRTLHRALDLGVSFWDTAETYGPFANEALLGNALAGKRQKVVLATKFAWRFAPDGTRIALDGSPANIRKAFEGSLRRLKTDYIDLYYQHRLDRNTPIEETVGAMADLVKQGKVRYIGLSEVGPTTLRKAHAVHPVTAVQSEYSLWERAIERQVLPTLRELKIGLVAYSPVGRGFLTGAMKPVTGMEKDDFRKTLPRFQEANLEHNMRLLEELKRFSAAHRVTPSQVALAWLLNRGPDIVPIPGTTRVKHLEENAGAADLHLSKDDWDGFEQILAEFRPAGERYTDEMMKLIDTA